MLIPQKKQYNVGIYTRLSTNDNSNTKRNYGARQTSQSIENQVNILTKYVQSSGWNIYEVYSDDGYVGSNFERPAFKKMIEDAKKGYIDLIVVKDLSRFSRDAVGLGMYTEELFPNLGIRFISLNENIDSYLDNTEFMPFYAMMNDYHLKDLSKKIKKSLRNRAERGINVQPGILPYGYIRSNVGNNHLVVDEEVREVVEMIFELRLQKKGFAKIAGILNDKQIDTPTQHWNKISKKEYKRKYLNKWSDITVSSIVKNEVYTGKLVQNKTGTISYKNQKTIIKDESDWIVKENAHEAIIPREVWEETQKINLSRATKNPYTGEKAEVLFKDLLKCADCGRTLVQTSENHRRKSGKVVKYISYLCPVYYRTGRTECSAHRIFEIGLKEIVQEELQKLSSQIEHNDKELKATLEKRLCSDIHEIKNIAKDIANAKKQIADCDKKEQLYFEDYVSQKISAEMFSKLTTNLATQQKSITDRLQKLTEQKNTYDEKLQNIDKWINHIKKYATLQNVDRTYLEELIDYIEIGERQVVDGKKYQDIKIVYKFIGYEQN